MTKNKSVLITLLLVLSAGVSLYAQGETSAGYASGGGAFLFLPMDARAGALGVTGTAWKKDGAGRQLNPAVWDALKGVEAEASYALSGLDMQNPSGRAGGLIGDYLTAGISFVNAGVKEIEGRDASGNPTGSFNYAENAAALSLAGRINKQISLGVRGRYVFSKLADGTAWGYGFDFGSIYRPVPMLSLGLSALHAGSKIKWSTDHEDAVHPQGRFGFALHLLKNALTISSDVFKSVHEPLDGASGIEYTLMDMLCLRGGVSYYRAPDLSLGVGLKYKHIGFDYSYEIPNSGLTKINRFTLRYIQKLD